MCRLTAYSGSEISLEKIISAPCHSLIEQSQGAAEAKLAVNGDGFDIAWYGQDSEPGLYRDVLPAWSDGNLVSICRMVCSSLFSCPCQGVYGRRDLPCQLSPVCLRQLVVCAQRANCADFGRIRRKLEASLPDKFYDLRRGTTDSELFFLLLLSSGMMQDPKVAIERTVGLIQLAQQSGKKPNRLACVFSDGKASTYFAIRAIGRAPCSICPGRCVRAGEPLHLSRSMAPRRTGRFCPKTSWFRCEQMRP